MTGQGLAELSGSDVGQRPLVPWLIRVFQNKHISELRQARGHYPLPEDDARRISGRLGDLLARIEARPKSRGWKLRAKVGERKRWYELPDEVS